MAGKLPPRASDIERPSRDRAHEISAAELDAVVELVESLADEDWTKATDCTDWDVFALVSHIAGTCDESAHFGVLIRHFAGGLRAKGTDLITAMNARQVRERADLTPAELVGQLKEVGPKAVKMRYKMPAPMRAIRLPLGELGTLKVAYVNDILYSRDMWTHRMDLAGATGRDLKFHGHECELIEQVILDLGRKWSGKPCILELEGYVDGAWVLGEGEPAGTATVDCLDYMRALSGRNDEPLVAVDGDSKLAEEIAAARVVF